MTATLEIAPSGAAPLQVGDRLPATLRFVLPANARAGAPRPLAAQDDLVVLEVGPGREVSDGSAPPGTIELPLVLVPFRTGALEHPGLVLPWSDSRGGAGELRTGPIRLQIEAQVAEGALGQPDDIRGPYGGVGASAWPWLAGGAIVLAGLLALLAWWRVRSARSRVPAPSPPLGGLSPEDWAGREIESLVVRLGPLPAAERAARLHLEVAPIVRTFLMARYGVPAPERTTGEVVALLAARDPDFARDLARMLRRCDGVKFARVQPPAPAYEELLDLARALVRRDPPPVTP